MNRPSETMATSPRRLRLFVTGDAPRSLRARANLAEALEQSGLDPNTVQEIDLTADPAQSLVFGIFATPALLRTNENGDAEILYGDLSERRALERFLALHR
ncbi:circadian clock KaiB family protein [Halochromatium sp.]